MKKTFVRKISEYVELHRDPKTGIAWVENGHTGNGHSAHPNISSSGSVRGMKSRGYWKKGDKTVRSHGFIYNISKCSVSDHLDGIALANCRCGGNHTCAMHESKNPRRRKSRYRVRKNFKKYAKRRRVVRRKSSRRKR